LLDCNQVESRSTETSGTVVSVAFRSQTERIIEEARFTVVRIAAVSRLGEQERRIARKAVCHVRAMEVSVSRREVVTVD